MYKIPSSKGEITVYTYQEWRIRSNARYIVRGLSPEYWHVRLEGSVLTVKFKGIPPTKQ